MGPQILGGEVATFVGGGINEVTTGSEQQWATQHVTIIHQAPQDANSRADLQPEKNLSYLSWDASNSDAVASVPLILTSQNDVTQEVYND